EKQKSRDPKIKKSSGDNKQPRNTDLSKISDRSRLATDPATDPLSNLDFEEAEIGQSQNRKVSMEVIEETEENKDVDTDKDHGKHKQKSHVAIGNEPKRRVPGMDPSISLSSNKQADKSKGFYLSKKSQQRDWLDTGLKSTFHTQTTKPRMFGNSSREGKNAGSLFDPSELHQSSRKAGLARIVDKAAFLDTLAGINTVPGRANDLREITIGQAKADAESDAKNKTHREISRGCLPTEVLTASELTKITEGVRILLSAYEVAYSFTFSTVQLARLPEERKTAESPTEVNNTARRHSRRQYADETESAEPLASEQAGVTVDIRADTENIVESIVTNIITGFQTPHTLVVRRGQLTDADVETVKKRGVKVIIESP
ncbi:MAG TPA: hypothetical protein VFQ45_03505, partial [Longimicrobium sp.]|nr:hypothetical protein [Longimicrobium sp.]